MIIGSLRLYSTQLQYSIPLNSTAQLRASTIVHKCRMNMIEPVLERSCVPHQENIYIVGVILNIFLWNYENVILLEN